ncbi:MAG: IS200/IS605 family transposase [Saprospiraceae bacterium]
MTEPIFFTQIIMKMAGTYTQMYVHILFAVSRKECLIKPEWKEDMQRYMAGIIRNHGHRLVAIKAMPDHVHILIKFHTTQSISDLVQDIKGSTSKWINESGFIESRFSWQSGYGAFSCDGSRPEEEIKNFEKQEEYHRNKTVREEYKEILEREGVTYEEKYLFEDVM